MSRGYWDSYDRPRRLPADGIKAKTQRGQFGKTWWASRWIAALERLVDTGRLSRGRSYARSGQVLTLEVSGDGVAAKVQGSRRTPYSVRIRFRRLSDQEWERVIDAMSGQALYAAKLLSGEMPAEIEEVFATAGVALFPAVKGDLETDCSCPDWANPCKHVAAVHYILGERFDADPFLMFQLRGRSQTAITESLRARRTGVLESDAELERESHPEAEEFVPLSETLGAFWVAPAGVPELAGTFQAPPVDALAIKRLGPPTFWHGRRDFTTIMEGAYAAISAYARRVATGDD